MYKEKNVSRKWLQTPQKSVYSSENFSSDKHVGYSDLVFEAQIKDGGTAALYVGIIAEHKKWPYTGKPQDGQA